MKLQSLEFIMYASSAFFFLLASLYSFFYLSSMHISAGFLISVSAIASIGLSFTLGVVKRSGSVESTT